MKKTMKSMLAVMLVCIMAVAMMGTMAFADNSVSFVADGAADDTLASANTSVAGKVILDPGAGQYIADITVDGESIIGGCIAGIDADNTVTIPVGEDEYEGPFEVTVAELPEVTPADKAAAGTTLYSTVDLGAVTGVSAVYDSANKKYDVSIASPSVASAEAVYVETYAFFANGAYASIEDGDEIASTVDFDVISIFKLKVAMPATLTREEFAAGTVTKTVNGLDVTATVDSNSDEYTITSVMSGSAALEPSEYTVTAKTYTVAKTDITVTAPNQNAVYSGKEITVSGTPAVTGTLAEGDKVEVTYDVTPVRVGTYTGAINILTAKVMNGETDVTKFYNITTVAGDAEVTPVAITVSAKDCEVEYDGAAHTANEYELVGALAEGDKLTLTYNGDATTVADGKKASVVATAVVTNASDTDVTDCYTITIDDTKGSVTIIPRAITLTVNNRSAEYTGKEISVSNVGAKLTSGSLVGTDEVASITTAGSGTSVGNHEIKGKDAVIKNGTTDVSANYNVTIVSGKLEITGKTGTKGDITVTFTGSKVYDGTELTKTYDVVLSTEAKATVGLVEVKGATVGPNAISKYFTESDVTITLYGLDLKTVLDKSDYNLKVVPGNVIISKKPLTITPSQASKFYDGDAFVGAIKASTEFAGTKITVTASAYPYNDKGVKVEGIPVGTYTLKVDPASVKVVDEDDNDLTGNFDYKYEESTLKVKANIGSANYSKSAGGTVSINCTLPVDDLERVIVDGNILVKDTDYTLSSGTTATVVTFKNAFLKELSVGTHSVVYIYNTAGSISANLTVTSTGSTTSTAAPQTGDNSNVTLLVVILAICFVAIVAVAVVLIKQRKKGSVQD